MPLTDDTPTTSRRWPRVNDLTRLVLVCNPNNPTGTHVPSEAIAAFLEQVPPHVLVMLDEAYIEFQTVEDPDTSLDLLRDFANLVILRTFSKAYGLAGLRVGLRARHGGVQGRGRPRAPAVLRQQARAGRRDRGAASHQDNVAERVEWNTVERLWMEEELASSGSRWPTARRTSAGSRSATTRRPTWSRRCTRAGVAVRPGGGLGGPGLPARHLRHPRRERALHRGAARRRQRERLTLTRRVASLPPLTSTLLISPSPGA